MRLYISADIEGVAGVTSFSQLAPDQSEYSAAREWMTNEVLAAIQGAESAGVKEFVVSDSHGNGENILLDRLPDNVELVRSWPRPLGMMQGIEDGEYIGAVLIGYHSSATWPNGVLAHTISGIVHELKVNGTAVGEAAFYSLIAEHYKVPILAISGDDGLADEMYAMLPGTNPVQIKKHYGWSSIKTPTSKVAQALIQSAVEKAINNRHDCEFVTPELPLTLEITFNTRKRAEVANWLPWVKRTGSHSIEFNATNAIEAAKIKNFFLSS